MPVPASGACRVPSVELLVVQRDGVAVVAVTVVSEDLLLAKTLRTATATHNKVIT